METRKLAFLGLGVMGFPMAGHLARAGHSVTVYNRSAPRAKKWLEGAPPASKSVSAPTPAAAAAGAAIVMMCVGNDDDVRAVALGPDGARRSDAAGQHPGRSHHGVRDRRARSPRRRQRRAASASSTRRSPAGQAGAENGKLTIMVGGDPKTFATAEPVLATYAKAVTLMGGPGAGQLTKMVNQICIAGLVQALSEGINFAARAGLDVERVLDVIGKGAAQSWQMDNRGKTMAADKFDFGFAVDWMRKDLSICMAEARTNGAALPVTAIVDQFYARVQALGGARWDTSSLIRLLR